MHRVKAEHTNVKDAQDIVAALGPTTIGWEIYVELYDFLMENGAYPPGSVDDLIEYRGNV